MVCRFHPLKGVDDFLQAIRGVLNNSATPVHLSLVGPDMTVDNPELIEMMGRADLSLDDVELCGPYAKDIAHLMQGLDILVIASRREGTPNILLEAMASGVTCVTTDVGDAARILDSPERTAMPGDVAMLRQRIEFAIEHLGQFKEQDRAVIERDHRIEDCMVRYTTTYQTLVN